MTSFSRCVMNSTERPCSHSARITAKTRSARSEGSAAVISSRISSIGSCARARARSIIRCMGRHVERELREVHPSSRSARRRRTSSTGVRVRRRFWAIVRSGTSAGPKTGASPMRAACRRRRDARLRGADPDRAAVGAEHAGENLDEVLFPAPLAPSNACASPGRPRAPRRGERRPGRTASRPRVPRAARRQPRSGTAGGAVARPLRPVCVLTSAPCTPCTGPACRSSRAGSAAGRSSPARGRASRTC